MNRNPHTPGVWRGVALGLVMALLLGFYVGRNVVAASARVGHGPSDFAHYYGAARATFDGESPYSVRGFLYSPPAISPRKLRM